MSSKPTLAGPVSMPGDSAIGVASVSVVRVEPDGLLREQEDEVAREEPLEIRLSGETLATTMRTPGHDHELVAGFLLSEGLITGAQDLGSISHCGKVGEEDYGNVIDVAPAPGSAWDLERTSNTRRGTLITSACGVCGRASIDDLLARHTPLDDALTFDAHLLASLTERLREGQANFRRTGGVHAAAVATAGGEVSVLREDVGRHNAVDKAVGRMLLDAATPLSGHILIVSGRTSFEIVAKAVAARISAIVSVSAPSSLAIATAERFSLLLAGFVRGGTYNVYAGKRRLKHA